MNPDSENFDSLRKLMAIKRHEIPPPGYFDGFSRNVMARIKSGDYGEEMGEENSWVRRFLGMFNVKPVFAGAFGTAVCAFLISGILTSEPKPVLAGAHNVGDATLGELPLPATLAAQQADSVNSNAMAGGSLFDQFSLQARPASERFYLPAGN
jgi:hypothetical protein